MFDPKFQEMAKQFVDSLPSGLKTFNQEIENHLNQFLQQCFAKMNLVTREEFDIQTQVLATTRAKLEQLEQLLQTLATQVGK